MKLQGSAQLPTVLAMYNQELNRDKVTPTNQSLRTKVRRHIDQMTRTRNFEAGNERIETGVLVKSHKGRKVRVERKVGECFQKQLDSVRKGTPVVVPTGPILVKERNHPLLLPRLMEESLVEIAVQEERVLHD